MIQHQEQEHRYQLSFHYDWISKETGCLSVSLLIQDQPPITHVLHLPPSYRSAKTEEKLEVVLFNTIHEMSHKYNIPLSHLSLITCIRGPGSFTTMRVILSAMQGLFLANALTFPNKIKLCTPTYFELAYFKLALANTDIDDLKTGNNLIVYDTVTHGLFAVDSSSLENMFPVTSEKIQNYITDGYRIIDHNIFQDKIMSEVLLGYANTCSLEKIHQTYKDIKPLYFN